MRLLSSRVNKFLKKLLIEGEWNIEFEFLGKKYKVDIFELIFELGSDIDIYSILYINIVQFYMFLINFIKILAESSYGEYLYKIYKDKIEIKNEFQELFFYIFKTKEMVEKEFERIDNLVVMQSVFGGKIDNFKINEVKKNLLLKRWDVLGILDLVGERGKKKLIRELEYGLAGKFDEHDKLLSYLLKRKREAILDEIKQEKEFRDSIKELKNILKIESDEKDKNKIKIGWYIRNAREE